jgi:hypothetical protein
LLYNVATINNEFTDNYAHLPLTLASRKKSAQPHPFAAGSAALRSLLAATPEYEVEMWVDDFTMDVFRQDRDLFLVGLDK